ncbi:MAG: DNA translocase FtsK [Planctomycetota bacterium]|nr:DNA translocase FtsK [Planctomycetota bacterium]
MEHDRAQETTAIVTGLGLGGLGLFCGLSLFSHAPADVMDYHAASAGQVHNLGGLLGAHLAQHLLCLYGIGAWILTACLLVFGAMICAARSMSGMLLRGAGAVLMTAVVAAWAGTTDLPASPGAEPAFRQAYPAGVGGLVGGAYLAAPLVSYFGAVGVYLVLVTAGLLAGLLIAQDATETALALVGRGCARAMVWGWEALLRRARATGEAAAASLTPATAQAEGANLRAVLDETRTGRFRNEGGVLVAEEPGKRHATKPRFKFDPEELKQAEAEAEAEVAPSRRKPAKPEKDAAPPAEKNEPEAKAPKESKEDREAKEAAQRREEAVRQAEQAEAERQRREKEVQEQSRKEAVALERLERERAAKQREQDKARAKLAASLGHKPQEAPAAPEAAPAGEAEKPPKPKLPDDYNLPDIKKLEEKDEVIEVSSDTLKERGAKLIETLWEFKIGSRLVNIHHGPTVTMFELSLDPGIKVSRVLSLSDNLAMAMKSEHGVRIVAPLPGRDSIGIEIPNTEDYVVRMRPILESPTFRAGKWTLPLVLGRDATGTPLITDLATMPHLLIAGTTGSGKSICVNSIILSLMVLRRPHEVKLILVDPKQVEMTDFRGIPHLLSPVVTDMKLAAGVLTWAVEKMEQRYERMSKVGVRNISSFNKLSREERLERLPKDEPPDEYLDKMPYLVVIVDEFADLMMTAGKEIEQSIARLAQKARAAGIHVILATQRPSADVVTGLIKTNLPCRICFQVKSKIDSRIVLDTSGADKLAGKGDMLFLPPGSSNLIRAKGVYIADHELQEVVKFCKNQAEPIYSDEIEQVARLAAGVEEEGQEKEAIQLDDRFDEAVECFLALGRASTSLLQRRMSLGYTRAAKVCDQMEALGIVGPDRGAKGRELLITPEGWESYKRSRSGASQDGAWGPLGSKDNPGPGAAPEEELSAVALLDPVDGTKADAEGNDPEAGDMAAEPDAALVSALDADEDDDEEET